MSAQKLCFVVCPIGEDTSETRKRSDKILKHVITPVVVPLGYEPVRADKISEPGMITSQIIQHIVDDALVVADLTESNPNVFYELALRHAARKPFIQLIRKGDKIPFDVGGMRTIPVDLTDPDDIEIARAEITKQIQSVEGKSPKDVESPVSYALEIQMLRQSEKPEERSLAQVLSAIADLRGSIQRLETRPENSDRMAMEWKERARHIEHRANDLELRFDRAIAMMQKASALHDEADNLALTDPAKFKDKIRKLRENANALLKEFL